MGSVTQPVFGAGDLRDGDQPWSPDEIDCIHANFQALSTGDRPRLAVQIGPSHNPELAGHWPWGLTTALRKEPGHVLAAKLDHLPRKVLMAVRHKAVTGVSVEIDPIPPHGLPPARWIVRPEDDPDGQGYSPTLVGVAFLGLEQPQIKWLRGVAEPSTYAVRPRSRSVRRGRSTLVFSEVRSMAENGNGGNGGENGAAAKDALLTLLDGQTITLTRDLIGDFPDELLAKLAEAAAPAAGTGDEGVTAQEMPPRDQMIADILEAEPDRDRAELEAMSDDELFALWQSVTGASPADEGMSAFSEPPTPAGTTAVATTTPTTPATRPAQTVTFSSRAEFEREVRRIAAPVARDISRHEDDAQRAKREAKDEVDSFFRWAKETGVYLPRDEDRSNDHVSPCLRTELESLPHRSVTVTFADRGRVVKRKAAYTPLTARIARLKDELPKLRKAQTFSAGGGLIPTPAGGGNAEAVAFRERCQARLKLEPIRK